MRVSSTAREFLSAASISLASGVVTNLLLLGGSIIAARILDAEGFGCLSMLNSTASLLGFFAGTGIGTGASRLLASAVDPTDPRVRRQHGALALVAVLLGVAACGAVVGFRVPIAAALGIADGAIALVATGLLILLNALNAFVLGSCLGLHLFAAAALIPLAAAAMTPLLLAAWAPAGGLAGATAAYPASVGVTTLLGLLRLRWAMTGQRAPLMPRTIADFGSIWSFSLPAALQSLVLVPVAWSCRWVLSRGPNGFAETAIFSAALSWMTAVLFVPNRVGPYFTALLARASRESRNVKTRAAGFRITILATLLAAAIPGMAVVIAAPLIMSMYGSSFASGSSALRAMAAAAIVGAPTIGFRSALLASGRAWDQLLSALSFVVAVAASVFLMGVSTARITATDVALAYCVGFVVVLALQARMVLGRDSSHHATREEEM